MTENQLTRKAVTPQGRGYVCVQTRHCQCLHARCSWSHSNNPLGSRSQRTASQLLLAFPQGHGSNSYYLVRANRTIHLLTEHHLSLSAEVGSGWVKFSNQGTGHKWQSWYVDSEPWLFPQDHPWQPSHPLGSHGILSPCHLCIGPKNSKCCQKQCERN